MSAALQAGQAAKSTRGNRALAAFFLAGVATFLAAATLLAKRDVEYRAVVGVVAERDARGGPDLAYGGATLESARLEVLRDVRGVEAVSANMQPRPHGGRGVQFDARWAEGVNAVDGLNSFALSLASDWNEQANAAAVEEVAQSRRATNETRRRRDALEGKVRRLETELRVGGDATVVTEPAATALDSPANPAGENPTVVAVRQKVQTLEADLAQRRSRYTDEHPEVLDSQLELKDAKARLAALTNVGAVAPTVQPESPSPRDPNLGPAEVNVAKNEELAAARLELADANRRLSSDLAAEANAIRLQAATLASPPWRREAASAPTRAFVGNASAPWGGIAIAALVVGSIAAFLARGLRPTIDSAAEAAAIVGAPVIGVLPADGVKRPKPFDPGLESSWWLMRFAAATIAAVFTATLLAASAIGVAAERIAADPASLFALAREWLTSL